MKRIGKNSRGPARKRSPKLPDELLPIVDAVVEVVFERLRSATMAPSAAKGPASSRKTARLNLPLPKQRTALAEALADLLLSDLASRARADRPKPGSRRVTTAPQRGHGSPKRRHSGR